MRIHTVQGRRKEGAFFTEKVQTKLWLWLAVLLTIGGAVLLYPIGAPALNILFILVKIGMLAGLAVLLFPKKAYGLAIWAPFSAGAVVMTIVKWSLGGHAVFLFVVSILIDIGMPTGAYFLLRRKSPKA